jgi:hypothetical protein
MRTQRGKQKLRSCVKAGRIFKGVIAKEGSKEAEKIAKKNTLAKVVKFTMVCKSTERLKQEMKQQRKKFNRLKRLEKIK